MCVRVHELCRFGLVVGSLTGRGREWSELDLAWDKVWVWVGLGSGKEGRATKLS